jgi:hypothetical protein
VRLLGFAVNLLLRATLASFVIEAWRKPADPRFAGKGIGVRGVAVITPLTLLVPAVHVARGDGRPYPVWVDNLHLSIYWLDLLGNVFDLYDRHFYFDLLPHAHGTGAATITAGWLLRSGPLGAVGVAQVAHVLLEGQEYYSDVFFGYRNVRGTFDVINDLLAGVVGSVGYALLWRWRGSRD